ncbi:hypothetical protein PG993_009009 [Apiospora rasikravindrae]|uniref:Uncharacterized protein n=1 Tax=Apiospora rasikravindrae TaxID=990691 RepID=A0ABR1SIA5_9PEZI
MPAPPKNPASISVSANNGNSGGNGNGGGSSSSLFNNIKTGGRNQRTHTATLSLECQSRRFNPEFKEWGNNGEYYAKVKLRDCTISDGRAYRTLNDAKQSVAEQAVAWIRTNMPKGVTPCRTAANATNLKQEQVSPEKSNSGLYHGIGVGNNNGNGGSGGGLGASHYSPGSRGRSSRPTAEGRAAAADHKKGSGDRHELLERIRSLYGHSRGPSEAVLGDPIAARAFLEGFALGDQLRESAGRAERRRSRSPKGARGDRDRRSVRDHYRERSAARRAVAK